MGVGKVAGESEGNATGAGADVDQTWGGLIFKVALENEFNEGFGFGAGDQSAGIAVEFDSIEMSGSEYVLKGFVIEEAVEVCFDNGFIEGSLVVDF